AINEAGAVAVHVGERRLYPIGVGEKGVTVYRLTFRGAWGHGSMPRPDNALLLAADAAARLAAPMPARLTPVMQAFLDGAIAATDGEARRTLLAFASGSGSQEALAALCSPVYARALDSLLRDTISPNVLH